MKKINICIMVLLIIPFSFAFHIDSLNVKDIINLDASVNEELTIKLANNSLNEFSIKLPEDALNVIVNKEIQYDNNVLVVLNCTICYIVIEYDLKNTVVRQPDGSFIYTRTLNFETPEYLNYTVTLPVGSIVEDSDDPPIVPKAMVETNGRNIIISWVKENPVLPEVFLIKYDDQKENTSYGWYFLASIFIILILVGVLFLLGKNNLQLKKNPVCPIPLTLLTPDEKKMVKYIQEQIDLGEELTQKNIGKGLNWSKSKTSSVITGLEYKKIIEREKYGRNYKVTLIGELEKE